MSRMLMCASAALVLAGCARIEANMLVQQGQVRVDPHPTVAGGYRIAVMTPTTQLTTTLAPFNITTPEGRRELVAELVAPSCKPALVEEEGILPLSPSVFGGGRQQVILRVTCPSLAQRAQ